jgi:hypothetical protein
VARACFFLLGLGWALAAFTVWRPEDRLLLNRVGQPTRLFEYTVPELGRWLPSLTSAEPRDTVLAAAWLVLLVVLVALGRRAGQHEGAPKA